MSATLFVIDKIEGNSNIGVPVFSKKAKFDNSNYAYFSPRKQLGSCEK